LNILSGILKYYFYKEQTLVIMPSISKCIVGIACAATLGPALMPLGFIGLGCIRLRRAFSSKKDSDFYNTHPSIEKARSVSIMLAAAPVCFGMVAVSK
jgi:hypothetical protein